MSTSANRPTKSAQARRTQRSSSNFSLYVVGGAILALIALVIFLNVRQAQPVTLSTAAPDLPAEWLNRSAMGNPEAKVVVEAYEDFRCPHCFEWTETIKPKLFEEYIKPGTARLEFRHLPVLGANSELAAMASECAADQGYFWQYHDQMFASQKKGEASFQVNALIDTAESLGINRSDFSQCMNSLKHQRAIADGKVKATNLGLTGTPSVFVAGTLVADPTVYANIKKAIDDALATAQ